MVAGGLACCISRTLVSPLNAVSQFQSSERGKNARARVGVATAVAAIVRARGVRGLWRGNGVQCLHGFPEKGLAFFVYESCHRSLARAGAGDENARCFAAGAAAGLVSTAALYPAETLANRLCVAYAGDLYRGLYTGLVPSLAGVVPSMGLTFALYHAMKRRFGPGAGAEADADAGADARSTMAFAALAATAACFATWPLHGVRQRMCLCESAAAAGARATAARVWRAEGLAGFYVGCLPALAKIAPKSAIHMTAYELLSRA